MNQPQKSFSLNIPREKLGLPGAHYELSTTIQPEPPQDLESLYCVAVTLSRGSHERTQLSFASTLDGDSYFQIANPKDRRTATELDHLVALCEHSVKGVRKRFEMKGIPNDSGRLGKVEVEVEAKGFVEADEIARSVVNPFLSMLSFEFDTPAIIYQVDVTQVLTGNCMMTYTAPFVDSFPGPSRAGAVSDYLQKLQALYREGLASSSAYYQFLCWYKILEGINGVREREIATQPAGQKQLQFTYNERIPNTLDEMEKMASIIFPHHSFIGGKERMHEVFKNDVVGWKFNRVMDDKLRDLRIKIAHMILEDSGEAIPSPDSGEHLREVERWLSLLRFMVRLRMTNELNRLPQPTPSLSAPPNSTNIADFRRHMLGK